MNGATEEKMSVAPDEPLEALDKCVGSSDKYVVQYREQIWIQPSAPDEPTASLKLLVYVPDD
jgi:hypothetical protein